MPPANPRGSSAANGRTHVVMLGTGTPRPDPDRCGLLPFAFGTQIVPVR